VAPWGRAGQWSLRLPCAAPRRHASWGRLSSEGLDGALLGTVAPTRLVAATDLVTVFAHRSAAMPRILAPGARLRIWRGRYSAGAATDSGPGVALAPRPSDHAHDFRRRPGFRDGSAGKPCIALRSAQTETRPKAAASLRGTGGLFFPPGLPDCFSSCFSEPRRPSGQPRASHLSALRPGPRPSL
jgi:hypothetical protein